MEKVRAKFYVQKITKNGYSSDGKPITSSIEVKLLAIYAPKDTGSENHKFWQASPSGDLSLSINNPACFDFFKEGEELYIDFVKPGS